MALSSQISPDALAFRRPPPTGGEAPSPRAGFSVAAALAVHICFAGLIAWDDWREATPTSETVEVPVDLVREEPPQAQAATPAPEPPPTPPAANSEGEAPKAPTSPPATRSPRAAAKPPPPVAPAEQGAEQKDKPPAPEAETSEKAESRAQSLPLFALPNFMAVSRMPSSNAENADFRRIVLAMIEKEWMDPQPPGSRSRLYSVAVTFEIDDSGNPLSLALARSSGQPALDAAALDMVRRAAPFPAPPAGAFRRFAPILQWGED